MKRRNIYFMIVIALVFLGLKGYDFYKQHKEGTEQTQKMQENPYSDFASDTSSEKYRDNIPDVFKDINSTVKIRFNKKSDTKEYSEAEIRIKSAELLENPKAKETSNASFSKSVSKIARKADFLLFEEEYRYLYVEFVIKNISDKSEVIQLDAFSVNNKNNFGSKEWGSSGSFNYIKLIEEGKETVIESESFKGREFELEANKEYTFQAVEIITPGQVYDLYFVTNNSDSNMPNDQAAVELGIALYENCECDFTDNVISDYQKRDLKQLRINAGYTSYSFFEEQTEKYNFSINHFYDFDETVGKPFEQAEGEIIPGKEMKVLEAKLVESKEALPDKFRDSTYLEQMLNLYLQEYQYEENEYRYIYLKIKLKELGNMGGNTVISNDLWLYNRDESNNLWTFGCADDYYIISSTNEKQVIGCQNIIMEQNEEIEVEAVYIVVPNTVYDLYIYNFNEGLITRGDTGDSDIYGAISLNIKKYEKGGIKQ